MINAVVLKAIEEELERARKKFPKWPKDHIHAAAIVAEEAGELIRAALQYKYEFQKSSAITEEAIQTAAMCIRLLEE